METVVSTIRFLFSDHPAPEKDALNSYKYQPLQAADSIRLVCLTTTNGKLRGTLKEVRLSEKPEYHALSYVWGEAFDGANRAGPNETRPFVLDGHATQVTANLADSLDTIVTVDTGEHSLPMVFWIDAICINQGDEEEKSAQVGMMCKIYDQAGGIIIWLGKHDAASQNNIVRMYRCYNTLQLFKSHYGGKDNSHTTDVEHEATGRVAPRPDMEIWDQDGVVKDRDGWESLGRFFVRRRWWHRMWTVQEYIPKVSKIFMCGDLVFEPEHLDATLRLSLLLVETEIGFGLIECAGFSVPAEIETFRKIFYDKSRPPLTAYDVLTRFRDRAATDPRDKVFAPLGLLPGDKISHHDLRVDYSLPVEVVFTNVAEYLLRTRYGLDWLEAVVPSRNSRCASWVPDWDARGILPFDPLPKVARDINGETCAVYQPWGTHIEPEEEPGPTRIVRNGRRAELHVMGISLDEITCLYEINKTPKDIVVIISWIQRACRELGGMTYPHTGESILQAVLRTITFDVMPVDSDIFTRRQGDLSNLASLHVEEIARKLFGLDVSMHVEVNLLRLVHLRITHGRRFAVTRQGFIGIVPLHSRVGDKVFSFSGGPVLYVIREIPRMWPKEYYYVGESYFYGLMDGEWGEKDSFGHPSQVVLV